MGVNHRKQNVAVNALRKHFTGDGANSRRLQFLRNGLTSSIKWGLGLAIVCSWALISGLFIGPEHDFFLRKVHEWMVSNPINQILETAHTVTLSVGIECVKCGLIAGFGHQLVRIMKPAVEEAKQRA
ncbi:MAG: hypothetical protein KJP07_08920 [Desulfatitalea sp.]|nr:hypothetical protein [Desulfatitalea sp.]